jgi:ABC-type bacteriocin/lantibiotic exporter with double-glycine peptidase domain
VERLNEVFQRLQKKSPKTSDDSATGQWRGKFDNAPSLGQEEELNTLQNITFEVTLRETVAIVGRMSGKSTLVNLLQGL